MDAINTLRAKVPAGKLDIIDFGTRLIRSQDLDPIYTMLHGGNLGHDQTKRWLLTYWMFYHSGFSSYASEQTGEDYWELIEEAARNTTQPPVGLRWPRGTERRHFRGPKCVMAVDFLRKQSPEYWVDFVSAPPVERFKTLTHKEVIARVKTLPQFGPWIGFKVADMLERCLGVAVEFSDEVGLIYEEPRKALEILREGTNLSISEIYDHLMLTFAQLPAPPSFNRPCSHQEVETVLCKWKSHLGGHYPLGKDSKELLHSLSGWGATANQLLAHVPTEEAPALSSEPRLIPMPDRLADIPDEVLREYEDEDRAAIMAQDEFGHLPEDATEPWPRGYIDQD